MEVKAIQPKDRTYRVWDEKGLFPEVRPSGSRLWFFKYRHRDAEKRIGLGSYTDVTLAEPPQRRDEHRCRAETGQRDLDPGHIPGFSTPVA